MNCCRGNSSLGMRLEVVSVIPGICGCRNSQLPVAAQGVFIGISKHSRQLCSCSCALLVHSFSLINGILVADVGCPLMVRMYRRGINDPSCLKGSVECF